MREFLAVGIGGFLGREGMMTLETVRIIAYRAGGGSGPGSGKEDVQV
ncbi:MAG: hypothetical protein ACOC92_02040 [bacterium]